jgi:hypothetical protein
MSSKTIGRFALLAGCSCLFSLGLLNAEEPIVKKTALTKSAVKKPAQEQEFYEIRTYKIFDYDKQRLAENYLEKALLPALNRQGIDRVGVFINAKDENDHSIVVIIPFKTMDKFTGLNKNLAGDTEYQEAATEYFDRDKKNRVYDRIESRFLKAFAGMPIMEIPSISAEKKERIFEMRLYESHTEDHARRKVQMFNEGEIQTMRDVNLGPVFFGETLIGPQVPNLIYLLSATDEASHKKHFQDFLKHPDWIKIKDLPQYKGTVSKIQSTFLKPTAYSQL